MALSIAQLIRAVASASPAVTFAGMPSESALGIWLMSQYDTTRKQVPNLATMVPQRNVVTRNPRGLFTTGKAPGAGAGGGWLGGGFDGMTATEKAGANAYGQTMASRIVFASTANGLRYRASPTVAAGTYTLVIQAKSNTGSNQDFLMSRNGGSTTVTQTATTTWQTFTLEFTLASSTAVDLRPMKPASGSGDFLIDNAFLWRGAAASLPDTITWGGHLCIGEVDTESVSCTAGELALTSTQAAYMAFDAAAAGVDFTLYAVVKRIAAYTTAGAGRFPFFFSPTESGAWGLSSPTLALGEYDAEGYQRGMYGSVKIAQALKQSLFTAGDALDLFSDGGYHVISMKCKGSGNSNGNTIEMWLDDVCIYNTINTVAHSALNWFVAAVGGNNGLAKHKLNALAAYAKAHTTAETRQSVAALLANAASSSITVTPPKNILIAEGDSVTVGPSSNSYVQQSLPGLSFTGRLAINWSSASGSMLSTHTSVGLNVTDRLTAFHLPGTPPSLSGRRLVYSILIGANDLFGYTSAAAYLANLYSCTDQIRALGAKVVICTVLPKSSAWSGYATHNAYRATLNAQLRVDVVGGSSGSNKFDAIADFAADATMGPDAAANNATYYGDGLHPTAGGHTILASIWTTAVNSLLT